MAWRLVLTSELEERKKEESCWAFSWRRREGGGVMILGKGCCWPCCQGDWVGRLVSEKLDLDPPEPF